MQKIIISVSHCHKTNEYFSETQIKNKTISIKDGETIHQAIAEALSENDYCETAYKGEPQGNIYRDDKDGNSHIIGYHYRTKHDIQKNDGGWKVVFFTTWVTIHGEVVPFELLDIEN